MGKYDDLKRASQELDQFFVWPEDSRPDIAHDSFDFELPIIDLSPVLKLETLQRELKQGSNRQALASELESCLAAKSSVEKEIRAACEEYGFFQIINHGFPMSLVDQLRQSFIQLFSLPLEVKTKVSVDAAAGTTAKDVTQALKSRKSRLVGYNPIKRSNAITRTGNAHIWNEGFELESPEMIDPGATEEIASTLWPEEPRISQQWRSGIEEYGKQASRVSFLVLELMASSLGLPEGSVEKFLGYCSPESLARLRLNHYPVCPQPELTWGIHGHSDPSVMTLLHQDDVGGLQIGFKDGTWHGVRPMSGAFVVNVGDYCQAWTNGRFISAQHRVVANEKTQRYSIAYFVHCVDTKVIRPRPELVDAEHPLRYKPLSRSEYWRVIRSSGLNVSTHKEHLLDKAFGAESAA